MRKPPDKKSSPNTSGASAPHTAHLYLESSASRILSRVDSDLWFGFTLFSSNCIEFNFVFFFLPDMDCNGWMSDYCADEYGCGRVTRFGLRNATHLSNI